MRGTFPPLLLQHPHMCTLSKPVVFPQALSNCDQHSLAHLFIFSSLSFVACAGSDQHTARTLLLSLLLTSPAERCGRGTRLAFPGGTSQHYFANHLGLFCHGILLLLTICTSNCQMSFTSDWKMQTATLPDSSDGMLGSLTSWAMRSSA